MTVEQARKTDRLTIRVIRTLQEIEDVRDIWVRWQKHPVTDIDFYLEQECTYPGFVRPHIIVLYREGNPEAMLVGKLIHTRVQDFSIGLWSMWKPRARILRIPGAGLLGNPEPQHCEIFVREIMAALERNEADMATFRGFPVDSPTARVAATLPTSLHRDPIHETELRNTMKLPGSIEEVLRGLSHDHRKMVRREARSLQAAHSNDLRVKCFTEVADMEQMIHDVEEVARKAWQRGRGGGFVDSASMRMRLHLAARKGWLRTYVLYLADRPSAFWMVTLYGGTCHLDYTGYDPGDSRYAPGTFLFIRMLEDLCRQNVRGVDFGPGRNLYKRRFGNCNWQEAAICVFAGTPRGIMLRVLRSVTGELDRLVRSCIGAIGLMPRVKKVWRQRLTRMWRLEPVGRGPGHVKRDTTLKRRDSDLGIRA